MLFSYPLTLLQTLSAVVSLCVTYYLYLEITVALPRRRLAASKGCLPPPSFPASDPIFGLDFFYENFKALKAHRALELFTEKYWRLGRHTAKLNVFGKTIFTTIEPENVKQVLSLSFRDWEIGAQRKKVMEPFLGEGIFTTDGAEWQHSRDMLRPNFVRAQVGDCEMFERHVQHLIQAIPKHGETVDLQPLFSKLTLDIATDFLLGKSTDSLSQEGVDAETKEFVRAIDRAMNGLGAQDEGLIFWIAVMMGIMVQNWTLRGEFKIVHDYVDGLIEKALAEKKQKGLETTEKEVQDSLPSVGKERYIFLHSLLSQTTNKLKIRSELLNILLAGRETTSALLSNLWFVLSKNPRIFAKLQHEISTTLPDNSLPTYENLKEMKYLRAVLNESLRVHPIVPENARIAQVDTMLPLGGGEDGKSPIFVKKGQIATWSLYAMHRRRDFYGDDAEEFKPERWLDTDEKKGLRVGWEYLPFHGGPRICIGQQFALTETSYITVRLMQEFSGLESRDAEPWREKFSLICSSYGGCKVGLRARV